MRSIPSKAHWVLAVNRAYFSAVVIWTSREFSPISRIRIDFHAIISDLDVSPLLALSELCGATIRLFSDFRSYVATISGYRRAKPTFSKSRSESRKRPENSIRLRAVGTAFVRQRQQTHVVCLPRFWKPFTRLLI